MKRRPLVVVSLLFIAGILSGRFILQSLPPVVLLSLTTALLIAWAILYLDLKVKQTGKVLLFVSIILLGAYLYCDSLLPEEELYSRIDKIKSVKGRVANYPTEGKDRSTFVVKPAGEKGYLKVFYYHQNSSNWLKVNYGDSLWLGGKFEIPWEFANFNYREYLLRRDIWGVVSIWGRSQINKAGPNRGNPILRLGFKLRNYLFEAVDRYVPQPGNQLMKALLFGERAYLGEDVESSFRDAGVMHVLAVSGLHLGIIIGILWWTLWSVETLITKVAEKDYPIFSNHLVVEKVHLSPTRAYILITPLVILYLLIVGFRISLLRASFLFAFVTLGMVAADLRLIVKKWADPINGLAAACLAILLIDPKSLFDIGFQLSFSATTMILLFLPLLKRLLNSLTELESKNSARIGPMLHGLVYSFRNFMVSLLVISLAAQLGVIPFIAFHFGRIYFLAILANLLIIPLVIINLWVGMLVIIAGILHLTQVAGAFGSLEGGLLKLSTQIARFFGNFPFSYLQMNFNALFYLIYTLILLGSILILYKLFPKPNLSIKQDKAKKKPTG